ncbi:MAG: RmlC-like cupin domain-containing protein [Linnemannia gamsii]|nr:MAG: RmlC-like cupin domain-containing protein [Linnemannia gamsii]
MRASLLSLRAAVTGALSATLLLTLASASTERTPSRTITRAVLSEEQAEGVGARVRRSIGRPELRNHDPFLMLDEFLVDKNGGFPDHPHRGFETVTYMLEGHFQHEDFAGHSGIIGPGDVQWMTAGRGIVHSEMPVFGDDEGGEKALTKAHGLQLWINLPKEHKMCDPQYQELLDTEIPRAEPQPGVVIKVIAGESHGVQSKVYTRTPTMFLDVTMEPHKVIEQRLPIDFTGFIYMLSGRTYLGDSDDSSHTTNNNEGQFVASSTNTNTNNQGQFVGEAHHTLTFSDSNNGLQEILRIETKDEPARFVFIAGQPLNEPIVQHGPFVMNTNEEIYETFFDFRNAVNGFERANQWRSTAGN